MHITLGFCLSWCASLLWFVVFQGFKYQVFYQWLQGFCTRYIILIIYYFSLSSMYITLQFCLSWCASLLWFVVFQGFKYQVFHQWLQGFCTRYIILIIYYFNLSSMYITLGFCLSWCASLLWFVVFQSFKYQVFHQWLQGFLLYICWYGIVFNL